MNQAQEARLAAQLEEERLACIAANQSKHVGLDGKLRYDADGREVFPGPTGVDPYGRMADQMAAKQGYNPNR